MHEIRFPPFRPHPLFPGGHAQTLAGAFLPGRRYRYQAKRHQVTLDDGDILVLHDDAPTSWQSGGPTVLLIHGLAGSHQSGYMVRIAARLNAVGYRTFRMDLRTCGAGCGLAKRPYHAGRSDDARAALEFMADACPGSSAAIVGFSLGGNIVLKLLGENPGIVPAHLTRAAAVNPSADLSACVNALVGPVRSIYDRHFATLLNRQLRAARLTPETLAITLPYQPRRIIEFDDIYTAQVWGFGTAAHYYERSSSAPHVAKIQVPT
ncbi:MAG: YheT family hydrolase, partial [Planctomycetaceae bacterium]